MESFNNAYDEKVRPLMDKIDQVRAILSSSNDGVTFPSVVVVGDQSSGKSTLLESLSFVELPKGSGIVTRCPLVLRLRKSLRRQVYRIHDDNKKVLLDETKINILKYIEDETKQLAGAQKNVVENLIELLVEDPNVRDLTVVDLPGIARNPIADQPKDIHKQTTKLINKFISQPGSVILCVFPANVDIATVESFTLAREVDPTGIRTIGVITKSDLAVNHDTLIQQLLMERSDVLHLTLGFVAVRNRSTDEKISLEDARKREKEFFREHPVSASVGSHCLGIEGLINRLADLYSDRVKETFPKMRDEVRKKLKDVCVQLSKFPPALDTPAERLSKYYELADFYVENVLKQRFSNSYEGQHTSMINTLHGKFAQYHGIIEKYTDEFLTQKYRAKVREALSTCVGEQLPNFLPHPVLRRLIGEKLKQLWCVTDILIHECFRETSRLLLNHDNGECENNIFLKKLLPAFQDIIRLYLNEKNQTVHDQLQEMIRIETLEPYTLNPSYMSSLNRFKKRIAELNANTNVEVKAPSPYTYSDDKDELICNSILNIEPAVQEMIFSIFSYWNVIVKRFIDYATLTLRARCDFDVCPGIRDRLRRFPTEQADFVDSYLAEDTFARAKRQQLQQTKERLDKVSAILGGNVTFVGNNTFIDTMLPGNDSGMTLDALAKHLSSTTATNDMDVVRTKPPLLVPATNVSEQDYMKMYHQPSSKGSNLKRNIS